MNEDEYKEGIYVGSDHPSKRQKSVFIRSGKKHGIISGSTGQEIIEVEEMIDVLLLNKLKNLNAPGLLF
ncbi:MAG: hypothetical protein ACLRWM_02175 [Streptococcus sp.]